jgi:ankyrin repeat protein
VDVNVENGHSSLKDQRQRSKINDNEKSRFFLTDSANLQCRMSLSAVLEDFAQAIEEGDSNQIDSLLTNGSIDVNARLPREFHPPPLVFAVTCAARRVAVVEMLLIAGAHIDGVDDNDQTACYAAAFARDVDLLAVLLTHRPNLEIKEKSSKQSPLELSAAMLSGRDHIAVMLINAGASLSGVDDLLVVLASRGTAAIKALLNRGVVLNQVPKYRGFTSLHVMGLSSALFVCADVKASLNMLINVCEIDLEARLDDGNTCTHLAAGRINEKGERLRCFIDAGADVNAVNCAGQTPFHRVCIYECTVLLLAAGADPNARDRSGRSALLSVKANSLSRWTSILPAFVAAGADMSHVANEAPHVRADDVETARRDIAKTRFEIVRHRAMRVCIGLQSLGLDALQMCEILQHACGPAAQFVAFHQFWNIATTVKHFHQRKH